MGRIFFKFKQAQRLTQLLILTSFLITFLITRIVVYIDLKSDYINLPIVVNGFHIHHLVPGIFFLIISGYIGLSFWKNHRLRYAMGILFGIGAALTIDEFALWLFLNDVYWKKQGRYSVDAFIILAVLLILAFTISEVYGHRTARRIPILSRIIKPPQI